MAVTSSSASSVRKPALSPSRIAIYLECAVKYRYIYLDKLGRFYMKARAGYSFGSSLHHVLQKFHLGGGELSSHEMIESLRLNWISAGYQNLEQERNQKELGVRILQSYHTAFQEGAQKRAETIAVEKTLNYDMGRFRLTGRLDRIDRLQDGTIEVVDYKSGRLDITKEEVASDLAMSCYQLLLAHTYPGAQVQATIYCLQSGASASVSMSRQELDSFEQDLIHLGEQILDTDYMAIQPVRLSICPDCDFLSRCEKFWRSEQLTEGAS